LKRLCSMKRITRDRPLTPEETDKYNAIRDAIEREKPDIDARIRKRMEGERKAQSSRSRRRRRAT